MDAVGLNWQLSALLYYVFCFAVLCQDYTRENTEVDDKIEICEWETFNVTCQKNEIIIIKSALYGRMNLGRCIAKDFGNIGCGSDVTSYMDRKCSGRRSCLVAVISLHDKSICSTELKRYLEVSFHCVVAGSASVTESCPSQGHLQMTSPSGQIASSTVHETNIGGPKCPLRIVLPPYQTLNISMIDFSVALPQSDRWGYQPEGHYEPHRVTCDRAASSGFIVERNATRTGRNVSLCAGAGASGGQSRQRKASVYRSEGNVVEVVIYPQTDSIFLLMYHAVGCPPIEPPAHATVQRTGDTAVVSCNNSQRTWYLTCSGTQWVGAFTNCTKPLITSTTNGDDQSSWTFNGLISNMTTYPYGILLVVALGIAIGVAIGVFLLAVVLAYLRGRRQRNMRSRSSNFMLKASESEYEEGVRNHYKCTSLTDSSSLLTKREDQYSCPSMTHGSCTTIEPNTLPRRHISPLREESIIMTSLPDPPNFASSQPVLPEETGINLSRPGSSKKRKKNKDKTMDYKWDSLSITENEMNELSNLRESVKAAARDKNPFSISFSDRCRAVDEPYYFKFDGVVGYKIDRNTQRPDIVPAACTACSNNPNGTLS